METPKRLITPPTPHLTRNLLIFGFRFVGIGAEGETAGVGVGVGAFVFPGAGIGVEARRVVDCFL